MKNNFLANKNISYEKDSTKKFEYIEQNTLIKKKTVNINNLLNRVKAEKKNKKKENLLLLCAAIMCISITAIIIFI